MIKVVGRMMERVLRTKNFLSTGT